jgi:fatty-acyl-CoA synthase
MKAYSKGTLGPLLETTIGQHLEQVVANDPNQLALVMPHQNIRWSYAQFNQRIDELAAGLLAVGIEPGDRVAIWSPNRYEWILSQFATAKIGAIMVCINPAYRLYELEFVLNKVSCKTIISAHRFKTSLYLDMLNELAPELRSCEPGHLDSTTLPHLKTVIRMGEEKTPGMYNFADVVAMGGEAQVVKLELLRSSLDANDVVNIQFTSGTTGSPKGAALSHRNILNNAYSCGVKMRFTSSDKLCIPVPLYHCFGMVMGTLCCVAHGATMVLPAEVFDPQSTLAAVASEQCTALHGVPTMFLSELNVSDLATYDLRSLRTGIIAGATCPEDLMRRLIAEMGLKEIVIAYGQTECSPVNHATEIDDSFTQRTTTVGRPNNNWESKIIDPETGQLCDTGETGEVCARGYGVMSAYWGEEARTAETIDTDGYLHSGDLGEMDDLGYVKITGRIKDMIIRGGENIYPKEIEEFLCRHPDILEAQVFGVPDSKYGEAVAAWVQIQDGASLQTSSIAHYCDGQITHFKTPKYCKFVSEFPMTVTGKIQKFVMRDAYSEELGLSAATSSVNP